MLEVLCRDDATAVEQSLMGRFDLAKRSSAFRLSGGRH